MRLVQRSERERRGPTGRPRMHEEGRQWGQMEGEMVHLEGRSSLPKLVKFKGK